MDISEVIVYYEISDLELFSFNFKMLLLKFGVY